MMKMTWKLANDLMDCLSAMMISAEGRLPETDEEFESVNEWTEDTFQKLCTFWENEMGEEWAIEAPPEDEENE